MGPESLQPVGENKGIRECGIPQELPEMAQFITFALSSLLFSLTPYPIFFQYSWTISSLYSYNIANTIDTALINSYVTFLLVWSEGMWFV